MNSKLYIWIAWEIEHWHDLSVAIIYDWKIWAIELERLFKIKHFSYKYYKYWYSKKEVIDIAIMYLVRDLKLHKNIEISIINYPATNFDIIKHKKINYYSHEDHHLFHAMSSFYSSWFKKSVVLTMDFYWKNSKNIKESQTWRLFSYAGYEKIFSTEFTDDFKNIGIWAFYCIISELIWLEEGSVMGLSSYWCKKDLKIANIWNLDGYNVTLNDKIINRIQWIKQFVNFNESFKYNLNIVVNYFKELFWLTNEDYQKYFWIFNNNLDLSIGKFANIANFVQNETEKAVLYLANKLYEKYKNNNLCIAWGVWLNVLANTKIINNTGFKKLFIQPAANDSWLSLWALYYLYYILEWNTKNVNFNRIWLGNKYLDKKIKSELVKYDKYINFNKSNAICTDWAKLISKWKIIWWYQFGSEFWPRALWNRSILADPRSIEIRDRVNKIKKRQEWRPLAPVVLESEVSRYFKLWIKSPFMTFSSKIIENKKHTIPWVTHIDGTARYQSIARNENYKYYDLVDSFFKITNIPILINTSFNIALQPIVESPKDAIETYLSTDLDYLIIWNFVVSKKDIHKQFSISPWNAYLKNVFSNAEKQKKYYRNWLFFRKYFFNGFDADFSYVEEYLYSFDLEWWMTINIFNKTKHSNKGFYLNYKDICLQIVSKTPRCNWIEIFPYHIEILLNNIIKKVAINYDKFIIGFWF